MSRLSQSVVTVALCFAICNAAAAQSGNLFEISPIEERLKTPVAAPPKTVARGRQLFFSPQKQAAPSAKSLAQAARTRIHVTDANTSPFRPVSVVPARVAVPPQKRTLSPAVTARPVSSGRVLSLMPGPKPESPPSVDVPADAPPPFSTETRFPAPTRADQPAVDRASAFPAQSIPENAAAPNQFPPVVRPRNADAVSRVSESDFPMQPEPPKPPAEVLPPQSEPAIRQSVGDAPEATNDTAVTDDEARQKAPPEPPQQTAALPKPLRNLEIPAIRKRLVKLDDLTLSDEHLRLAKDHYEHAIEFVEQAKSNRETAKEYRRNIGGADESVRELQEKLSQPLPQVGGDIPEGIGLKELEQQLAADRIVLEKVNVSIAKWKSEDRDRAERQPQLPLIIEQTASDLTEERRALETPVDDVQPDVAVAHRVSQRAHIRLLESRLELYRVEQTRYEELGKFFSLKRDYNTRSKAFLTKRIDVWKEGVERLRREQAQLEAEEARRQLQQAHPALGSLARINAELTERRSTLQSTMSEVEKRQKETLDVLTTVTDDFDDAKEKEKRAGGLTTALGLLLRNQRQHLPQPFVYYRQADYVEGELTRLNADLMGFEEERESLGVDLAEQADELANTVGNTATHTTEEIREMALTLLSDQRKHLDDLIRDHQTNITNLTELGIRTKKLTDAISDFRKHIDGRILWIRSGNIFTAGDATRSVTGFYDLFRPASWIQCLEVTVADARQYPHLAGLAALACILLLSLRSWFKSLIGRLSEPTADGAPALLSTFGALLLTVPIACVWPALMWLIGWRMSELSGTSDFPWFVGQALERTALVFWSVELFRQICLPRGVAQSHLGWPESSVRAIHNNLIGVLMYGLPLVFIAVLAEDARHGEWAGSLGRLAFMAGMFLLTLSFHRLVNPRGAILRDVLAEYQSGLLYRTRKFWYATIVLAPLVLLAMSFAGYDYTARHLLLHVEITLGLCMFLLIGFSLVSRWSTLAYKRLRRLWYSQDDREKELPAEEQERQFAQQQQQIRQLTRAVALRHSRDGSVADLAQRAAGIRSAERIRVVDDNRQRLRNCDRRRYYHGTHGTRTDADYSRATVDRAGTDDVWCGCRKEHSRDAGIVCAAKAPLRPRSPTCNLDDVPLRHHGHRPGAGLPDDRN